MYVLLALQLIGNHVYAWTNLGTYQTWTACRNAVTSVVSSDNTRKADNENFVCVPTGVSPKSGEDGH